MAAVDLHHEHLQRRWGQEQWLVEERRQRLLERMGQPTEERPAVLRETSIAALQELLRFLHLLRHLYAYQLQSEPVERLRTLALGLWPEVRGKLNTFQGWLTGPWA
ncbi:MAG: hypothetical protein VKN15_06350 [Cyanobacteriota bacterium]|nr:hypothetical protein [Cyanobacteriota bacterium]